MSSAGELHNAGFPPPASAGAAAAEKAPRSWIAEAMLKAMSRISARLALAWIALVGLVAVFAPLLANSYPILVKMDDRWSSPMLENMTPADVTLLILFFAAVVLWFVKALSVARLALFGGVAVVVTVAALLLVHPPKQQVYGTYRNLEREGRIQWILRAPVPYSPGDRLRDIIDYDHPHPWAPSTEHWMGTSNNRADVLSHMIHACRIAMAVGFISTGIAAAIGIVVGGLMGYFVGLVDLLGMRLVEIFSSIPTIYLLLTFVAAFPEWRSIYLIMAIIGVTSWPGDVRFVRAEFLRLRGLDFVQAAIAAGLPLRSVLFRHLLPNALAPLLVSVSFGVAGAILAESTLSFLGLGIPLGEASWGQLLNEAVSEGGSFQWWLATFPGMAIFLTVLAYNLVGEALRDALDPRLRGLQ